MKIFANDEMLALLVRFAPAGIAVFDRNMNYLLVSERWIKDYRLENKSIIGKCHYEIFPEISESWKEIHRKALQGESQRCKRDHFHRSDGTTDWINWEIHPWSDNEGAGGIIIFAEVISDLVHLEAANKRLNHLAQELTVARDHARAASEFKSDFLAKMSHEIRTPMNSIHGMCNGLLAGRLSDKERDYATSIKQSADSLLAVVNDILDYSKIEAGLLDLKIDDSHIDEAVESACAMLMSQAEEKGLSINYIVDPGIPRVLRYDSERMRQILLNLLSNAVKFSDKGVITVSAKAVTKNHEVCVVRITVQDQGIGISRENLKLLFRPYTQFSNHNLAGTGLGLSICKQLVNLMNGSIAVESEIGQGSAFTFEVPLNLSLRAPSSNSNQEAEQSAQEGRLDCNALILIAEDHPLNQKVAQIYMEDLGLQYQIVTNGGEALDALRKKQFSLVLMDCEMPVMDGFTACRAIRLRENGTTKRLPIIAVTGRAMLGDKDKCIEAGMDDYLTKPIDPVQLKNILLKWLPTSSQNPG